MEGKNDENGPKRRVSRRLGLFEMAIVFQNELNQLNSGNV